MSTELIQFGVQGMTCASCVGRVERTLKKQPGVETASVNLAMEQAKVSYDPGAADLGLILRAVHDAGYQPLQLRIDLLIEGMTCAACVGRVEKAVNKLHGVVAVAVNLATEKATVEYLPDAVSTNDILSAIKEAGYQAHAPEQSVDQERDLREREQRELRQRLSIAAIFAVPVATIAMAPMLWPELISYMTALAPLPVWHWFEFWLASPVQFYAGGRFYRQGWAELRHFSPGMNTLVMMGSSAAYFYSVAAVLLPGIFPVGDWLTCISRHQR